MCATFTNSDLGKQVENANDETLGTVSAIDGETIHVELDSGMMGSIKAALGWKQSQDESVSIHRNAVDEITDETIHLETEPLREDDGAIAKNEPAADDRASAVDESDAERKAASPRDDEKEATGDDEKEAVGDDEKEAVGDHEKETIGDDEKGTTGDDEKETIPEDVGLRNVTDREPDADELPAEQNAEMIESEGTDDSAESTETTAADTPVMMDDRSEMASDQSRVDTVEEPIGSDSTPDYRDAAEPAVDAESEDDDTATSETAAASDIDHGTDLDAGVAGSGSGDTDADGDRSERKSIEDESLEPMEAAEDMADPEQDVGSETADRSPSSSRGSEPPVHKTADSAGSLRPETGIAGHTVPENAGALGFPTAAANSDAQIRAVTGSHGIRPPDDRGERRDDRDKHPVADRSGHERQSQNDGRSGFEALAATQRTALTEPPRLFTQGLALHRAFSEAAQGAFEAHVAAQRLGLEAIQETTRVPLRAATNGGDSDEDSE